MDQANWSAALVFGIFALLKVEASPSIHLSP